MCLNSDSRHSNSNSNSIGNIDVNDTRSNSNFAQFRKRKISLYGSNSMVLINVLRSNRHMHRLNQYLHIISICSSSSLVCDSTNIVTVSCYFSFNLLNDAQQTSSEFIIVRKNYLFIYFVSLSFRSRYFWRSFFVENLWIIYFVLIVVLFIFYFFFWCAML